MMMLLPTPATRASLRAFWLLLSLAIGAGVGLAVPLVGLSAILHRLVAALAVAAAVALPGLTNPYAVAVPYRAWNWGARQFSARAIRYVTAACFRTVVVAISRGATSARFELSSSESSMWKPRGTQTADAYVSQWQLPGRSNGTHWSAPLRAWMRASGPELAWTLLPFLMLIRMLDTGPHKSDVAATKIYTLY